MGKEQDTKKRSYSAERLRTELHVRQISQARFAEMTGINPGYLSRMLWGKVPCSDTYLDRAAAALNLPKAYLAGEIDSPGRKAEHGDAVWKQTCDIKAYLTCLDGRGIVTTLSDKAIEKMVLEYPDNRKEKVVLQGREGAVQYKSVQTFLEGVKTFSAIADQIIPLLTSAGRKY